MSLQSKTHISIGQKQIPVFKELKIEQGIGKHHYFELKCRMDVLEANTSEIILDSRNFINENFIVEIKAFDNIEEYKSFEFKGVVTQVKGIKGFHHNDGDIVLIKGYSPTILADYGAHYNSNEEESLNDIISGAFQNVDQSKLKVKINPSFSEPLLYSVQHNESAFEYTNRLAKQYGEWFYYDGKELVFGTPKSSDTVKLKYGFDLKEVSIELIPMSNKYNYFTNDFLIDQNHESLTSKVQDLDGYIAFSSQKNREMYQEETNIWVNTFNSDGLQRKLDILVEQQKLATDGQQVKLVGISDNTGISVGTIIKIEDKEGDYGSYRVISASHSVNEIGKYENSFTALPVDATVYPHTNINAFPYSDTQVAKVTENNDPLGLGRVKVQFAWQKLFGGATPWIRMVTPHAGGDKGFHFIPEIGEEVLVGFEGGNAERPYVLGSMYNGSQGAAIFQTEQNNIKAIKTRSGHIIELNDTANEETITITDKSSNTIQLNTHSSSILISAPETLTIMSKNLDIRAKENISITAGKNKKEQISGDYRLSATNIIEIASEQIKSEAEDILNQADNDIEIISKDGNVNKQASQKINNNSGEQSNLF